MGENNGTHEVHVFELMAVTLLKCLTQLTLLSAEDASSETSDAESTPE